MLWLQNIKTDAQKSWPSNVKEKFWPYFEKQNGRHSQLFKNHQDALKLEILQLGSSNMRKIYMARKVSLIVIWPSFEKKMAVISHVKWDYPIKKALYIIATRVPNVKTT